MSYRYRRGGRGFVIVFVLLVMVAAPWGYGLNRFVAEIPRTVADPDQGTDAIVVLTGGSERLRTGFTLMSRKMARRVYVSGVYKGVEVEELLRLYQKSPGNLSCCVDLGHDAASTRENASETATWVAGEGIRSLRLVTANYHMPRSLVEFRNAMPGTDIVPHPVFPKNVKLDDWWRWPGTLGLVAAEFNKYLLARSRVVFEGMWMYTAGGTPGEERLKDSK